MPVSLGCHRNQLPLDELDPVILCENAHLDQPLELGQGPAPCHLVHRVSLAYWCCVSNIIALRCAARRSLAEAKPKTQHPWVLDGVGSALRLTQSTPRLAFPHTWRRGRGAAGAP